MDADKIRQLKNTTGAGLADCKAALAQFDGDMVAAAELLKKNGRDSVFYYTIYESTDYNWLLEDDDAHMILHRAARYMKASDLSGRLSVEPAVIGMVASLEDTYPDYDRDEIKMDGDSSVLRRFRGGSFTFLVQEAFLEVLEQEGVTGFRAYPVKIFHKASKREWSDFWYVMFTLRMGRKELLQDNTQKVFIDKEHVETWFNGYMKHALEQLNWPDMVFVEREFMCCRPVVLDDSIDGDKLLLTELEQLFKMKKPHYNFGSRIDEQYFIDRLLEKFRDVDFERVAKAVDRCPDTQIFYESEETNNWFGMRQEE
ncbi:MAG: hypothetical protein OEZ39_07855 [Gammaproteobacteria bacterium]|nr:hypothetical protein [Gammaproteobacteria bacterium]